MTMNATNVGIPSMVQLQFRTLQQLNNNGVFHFTEGNPTKACECFRSALLTLKRLHRGLRPPRTGDHDASVEGTKTKTTPTPTQNAQSFVGGVRSGVCSGPPHDSVDETITLAASWNPVPMLVPMRLCEEKLLLAYSQLVGCKDNSIEDYSLIAMVLIFNLGATTQACARDKSNQTEQTLNTALQMYQLVFDCINVAQEQEVTSQREISRGEETASATSMQRPHQQLISAFRQMMLLSVLHNMGLAYEHLNRLIEARQCHDYIFPALHYLREGLGSEHGNLLRQFDVDVLVHGIMKVVLKKSITAPCA
jgi:hypothetical protein